MESAQIIKKNTKKKNPVRIYRQYDFDRSLD